MSPANPILFNYCDLELHSCHLSSAVGLDFVLDHLVTIAALVPVPLVKQFEYVEHARRCLAEPSVADSAHTVLSVLRRRLADHRRNGSSAWDDELLKQLHESKGIVPPLLHQLAAQKNQQKEQPKPKSKDVSVSPSSGTSTVSSSSTSLAAVTSSAASRPISKKSIQKSSMVQKSSSVVQKPSSVVQKPSSVVQKSSSSSMVCHKKTSSHEGPEDVLEQFLSSKKTAPRIMYDGKRNVSKSPSPPTSSSSSSSSHSPTSSTSSSATSSSSSTAPRPIPKVSTSSSIQKKTSKQNDAEAQRLEKFLARKRAQKTSSSSSEGVKKTAVTISIAEVGQLAKAHSGARRQRRH